MRAELLRAVDGGRVGSGIWLFSPLETLFLLLSFSFHVSHFFFFLFPSSEVRYRKRKDSLRGEDIMQMERSMADRACASPAWASSQPSSVLKHMQRSAGQGRWQSCRETSPRQCYLL